MPIEVKEIVEFLGFKPEEITDTKVLGDKFNSIYTRKDNVDDETKDKIVAVAFDKVARHFKKELTDVGVDLQNSEIKDKRFEEITTLAIGKIKAANDKLNNDFKALKATAGDPTKEYQDLEKKYKDVETKYTEASSQLVKTTSDFETFKTSKDSEVKQFKLNSKKAEIHAAKAKFPEKTPELLKKGFFSSMEETYLTDWDDATGKIITLNRATGKPVPGKVAGTNKEYDEILTDELLKADLVVKNNHAQNQNQQRPELRQEQMAPPVIPGRVIAPRMK